MRRKNNCFKTIGQTCRIEIVTDPYIRGYGSRIWLNQRGTFRNKGSVNLGSTSSEGHLKDFSPVSALGQQLHLLSP